MDDAPGRKQFYEEILPAEATVVAKRRAVWGLGAHGTVGLALSGGGIRSATFNLGVLQVFARRGLVKWVDYLSTVSGGGYIGSSLSTILQFEQRPTPLPAHALVHEAGKVESPTVKHLRSGHNYLAPHGLLDMLRIPAVLLRGILINLLVLVPYVAVVAILTALRQPNLVNLHAKVDLFFYRGGDIVFFSVTPWVVGAAALWVAVFPIVSSVGPRASYRTRSRYEQSFAILLLLLLVVPLVEAGPWLYHWFARLGAETGDLAGAIVAGAMALVPFARAVDNVQRRPEGAEIDEPTGAGRFADTVKIVAIGILGPLILLFVYFLLVRWLYGQPSDALEAGYHAALLRRVVVVAVIATLIFIATRVYVDINKTGLHSFYRDRLSAAYLFNPTTQRHEDRVRMSDLDPAVTGAPYHLVNAALNVPGTRDPNLQGRATDFFLMSPRWCGSFETGYCPTDEVERADAHFNLGTALAISGAAASPYMGPTTPKILVFVLTLLNVRLDYWFKSPGHLKDRRRLARLPGSQVGPLYLIAELLGLLSETSQFVNLSDGGHLENLGLYELLRRRCRYIVVCDAEQDGRLDLPSLGRVTAFARMDQGVWLNWEGLHRLKRDAAGLCPVQWVYGTVDYGPGQEPGQIIYIKSALSGNEPHDILAYRAEYPDFPHQSTADQFFDERQFESYRALGYFIADQLFDPAAKKPDGQPDDITDIDAWFGAVRERSRHEATREESTAPATGQA